MDHASKRRDGEHGLRQPGFPLELQIGQEIIDVWVDDTGIHFHQAGSRHPGGTLPWGIAIAMSLIEPHLPRMATIAAV
jgi:hypothetical protein